MKPPFDLIDRLQVRAAMLAIGRSTLRSQGAPGMVDHARKFLRKVDLRVFSVSKSVEFRLVLDTHTSSLANSFPGDGGGNWGAARKSLNIFLRDVVYCRPLCKHFGLAKIEPWLEVPIDSNVYSGLCSDASNSSEIPRWPGVKGLSPEVSDELQKIAKSIAKSFGVSRVHLDVRYWRKDAIDALEG